MNKMRTQLITLSLLLLSLTAEAQHPFSAGKRTGIKWKLIVKYSSNRN